TQDGGLRQQRRIDPPFDAQSVFLPDVQRLATRHLNSRGDAVPEKRRANLARSKLNIVARQSIMAAEDVRLVPIEGPPADRPDQIRSMAHLETQLVRGRIGGWERIRNHSLAEQEHIVLAGKIVVI